MFRQARDRLLFLTLAILALWIVAWATGGTGGFTAESMRNSLAGTGLWGIAAFVLLFAVGQLMRVPSTVFVVAAVVVYGRNVGFPVALLGAFVSAIVSFAVVRAFAANALANIQHPRIRRLLTNIDRHPIVTVALLRLVFQTAPPLNYALPLPPVRWRDHLGGSAVGRPLPVALMPVFFHSLRPRAAV